MDFEQIKKIKQHLINQLVNFPEDKRDLIKKKIESMSEDELENFIEENELNHLDSNKCLFCSIIKHEISSYMIAENENNIAILEINPMSKGHSLVIPKKHSTKKELTNETKEFAKIIGDKLKEKFSPKEVINRESEILNHGVIEVIPIYGNETEKRKATENELNDLQKIIISERIKEPIKKEEIIEKEIIKIKPRIP